MFNTKTFILTLIMGICSHQTFAAKPKLEQMKKKDHKKAAAFHKELAQDPSLKKEATLHEALVQAHKILAKGASGESYKKAIATIRASREQLHLDEI